MSDKVPGKVIYVGSIPYDQTEEQVLDIAKSIGPVVNMKMMFDKDTGRSKGFAFVEYKDIETASSAVRNLNNYSIGNRQLKCDFSTENSLSNESKLNGSNNKKDSLPPLPAGKSLNPGQTYSEEISKALTSLDQTRLYNLLRDAKRMSLKNPGLMEQLLAQCPQLSYALVEALLITQKADTNDIAQLLANAVPQQAQVGVQQNREQIKVEEHEQKQEQQESQAKQTQGEQEEELDEEKIALIKQVIEIPDEDLAGLSEEQRASILEIKENYRNGVYGVL